MDTNLIKNLVRVGEVSTVNPAKMTATVIFREKGSMVSGELKIITFGSQQTKFFWLPVPGEPVICLMLPNNSTSLNQGFIMGSYYTEKNLPNENMGEGKRVLDFGDGTVISYDRNSKELLINCAGGVKINGTRIDLNS